MTQALHPVPDPAGPTGVLDVTGVPPAAGPVDAFTRIRVGRIVAAHLVPSPVMDAHLDLIDARGAWYAEPAAPVWDPDRCDEFFGLVRHVVRTQLPGPDPDPDVETWLAAGRPSDPRLGAAWDLINTARYAPEDRAPARPRTDTPSPGVARVDAIVTGWPPEHLDRFATAYGTVERVMDLGIVTLPPVHR